ncbi:MULTISPECIES: LysR family transcriptional regulator [Aliagarivorans]|uniref:LysR family transcriptional regulator n=1 Tax=Aliagarivorans TaxID=882379 RepID=UPI00040A014B|nr:MULTISPECIES: LysR family transcriptional regulator [Aliagarivorans]
MRFSLKQLAVFEATALSGNVSQAAESLAMTQSAASMALNQLERSLGHKLFERHSKGVSLTSWGLWLRPRAESILFNSRQIEFGFAQQQCISGAINIGVSLTAAEHLFPEVISNIDREYPEVRVNMDTRNTEQVIEGIRNYQYDLGVIEGQCNDNRIHQEVWCRDYLTIVAGPEHPYTRFKRISLNQLEQAKWVLRESGSGVRKIFESALHGHIDDLDIWREYDSVKLIKRLVSAGDYLTCLPYQDVSGEIAAGKLVPLKVPPLNMERPLSFIWRAESGVNALRDCVRQEAQKIAEGRLREQPV